MRVAVAGGTGLLGRALIAALLEEGHAPAVLTRNPGRARRLFPSSVTLIKHICPVDVCSD